MNPVRRRALRLLLAWGEPFLISRVGGGGVSFLKNGAWGVLSPRAGSIREEEGGGTLGAQRVLDKEARRRRGAGNGAPGCLLAAAYGVKERRGGRVPAVPCGSWAGFCCCCCCRRSPCLLARSPPWAPLRRERERGRFVRLRWEPGGILTEAFLSGGRWEEEEPARRKEVFVLAGQNKKKRHFFFPEGFSRMSPQDCKKLLSSRLRQSLRRCWFGFFLPPENSSLFYSGGIKPKTSQPHCFMNMFYAQYDWIRVQCLKQIQKADLPE